MKERLRVWRRGGFMVVYSGMSLEEGDKLLPNVTAKLRDLISTDTNFKRFSA